MVDAKPLAKFRHPPVIEVVHGVQFSPLAMTTVHPGLFYAKIRDKYPHTQSQPPLAPVVETFDGGAPMFLRFGVFPQVDLARTWFVSNDDILLVQLQNDRLLLNWRRGIGDAEYPHFEAVSEEFRRVYRELEAFADEYELGQIQPNQCEMTYINHLKAEDDDGNRPFDPGQFFRMWRSEIGDWKEPLEDVAFNLRFLMHGETGGPIGRLTANFATLSPPNRGEKIFQLEITARGPSSREGLPGVVDFHEIAHTCIVNCFAGITTSSAHEKWERWQ